MIDKGIHITTKENPVLLDRIIQDIQSALETNLSWLDHAFGKAHKLIDIQSNGTRLSYPALYNGKGEYVSLLPNDNFGNFSWFDIYDPQKIDTSVISKPKYTFKGALIFWYDISSIYYDNNCLYTEEVKEEILKLLTTPGLLRNNGHFKLIEIAERLENVYKEYVVGPGVDRQFFMYPYFGLRIEFIITANAVC